MKKFISLFLCVAMVVCFIPTMAFAEAVSTGESGTLTAKVAKVGNTEYATLKEAVDAVEEGGTITILNDIDIGKTIINKSITLDLGGNTISLKNSGSLIGIAFTKGSSILKNGKIEDKRSENSTVCSWYTVLVSGATLTTENVEIKACKPETDANYNYIVWCQSKGSFVANKGTSISEFPWTGEGEYTSSVGYGAVGVAVIGTGSTADMDFTEGTSVTINEGTKIETTAYGVVGNGSNHNTIMNINGGEIISTERAGIYHPQWGKLNIKAGAIQGTTGIEVRSGKVNMTGGTIIGTGTPTTTQPNGNGTTSDGVGLAIAQHETKLPIEVDVAGGKIEGYSAFYEENVQGNDETATAKIKVNISGGDYNATGPDASAVYSETQEKFVSGGYFSDYPNKKYIKEGYVAVASDKSGYISKIEKRNEVESATAAPEVEIVNCPEEFKDKIETVAASVELDEIALLADTESQKISSDQANQLLTEAPTLTGNLTLYVQTYLDVKAEAYDPNAQTLKLDITPMKQYVACTDSNAEDFYFEDNGAHAKNAEKIGKPQEIEVSTPVQMNIDLPDGFVNSEAERVFVKHEKAGKTYSYDCEVKKDSSGKFSISFRNPHGFSAFTITKDVPAVMIDQVAYNSLQEAIDNAKDNDSILIRRPNAEEIVVNKAVVFSLKCEDSVKFTGSISAGNGYNLSVDKSSENGDIYMVTKDTTTSGGGTTIVAPDAQKPVITAENANVTLSDDGTMAVIKPADGYELVDVTVNGVSKGKADVLTGLKTGDKVVVTTQKIETSGDSAETDRIKAGVENTRLKIYSGKTGKGDGWIQIRWVKSKGFKVDGYELYRGKTKSSMKKYDTTKKTSYKNAKYLKKGNRYYYKVRGYSMIGGEKVYTKWSKTIYRIAK